MTLLSKSKNLKKLLRNSQKKFKLAGTVYYLLHHPVIRTEKSTSRVRIVYDASAKRVGSSLNYCLETGPNTLPQIIDVLLRFHLNEIALISVIKQAFLNVSIPEIVIFYDFYG